MGGHSCGVRLGALPRRTPRRCRGWRQTLTARLEPPPRQRRWRSVARPALERRVAAALSPVRPAHPPCPAPTRGPPAHARRPHASLFVSVGSAFPCDRPVRLRQSPPGEDLWPQGCYVVLHLCAWRHCLQLMARNAAPWHTQAGPVIPCSLRTNCGCLAAGATNQHAPACASSHTDRMHSNKNLQTPGPKQTTIPRIPPIPMATSGLPCLPISCAGQGACAHLNRASQQSRYNKLALPMRPDPHSYLQVVPQQRGPPSHCKHSRQEKHKSHLRRAANDLLSPRQPGHLQTVSASPLQRPGCLVEARQGPAAFEPLSLCEGCPAAALQLRGPSAVHSASGSPARGEAAVPGGVRVAYCLTAWCP